MVFNNVVKFDKNCKMLIELSDSANVTKAIWHFFGEHQTVFGNLIKVTIQCFLLGVTQKFNQSNSKILLMIECIVQAVKIAIWQLKLVSLQLLVDVTKVIQNFFGVQSSPDGLFPE